MLSHFTSAALIAIALLFAGLGIVARVPRGQRDRQAIRGNNSESRTAASVATAVQTAGDAVTLTFSVPVSMRGTPGIVLRDGGVPTTVTAWNQTSPTTIVASFAIGPINDSMVVQVNDPAIRTGSGGYMPAGTFPVA